MIRNERNNRRNQINKKFKKTINKMQYYVCDKISYINYNYFKRRKLKNKNMNNKIADFKNFERIYKLKSRLKDSKSFKRKRRE